MKSSDVCLCSVPRRVPQESVCLAKLLIYNKVCSRFSFCLVRRKTLCFVAFFFFVGRSPESYRVSSNFSFFFFRCNFNEHCKESLKHLFICILKELQKTRRDGRRLQCIALMCRRPLENDQVCIPSTCILFPITLTFHPRI